jgi:hypothetical protein
VRRHVGDIHQNHASDGCGTVVRQHRPAAHDRILVRVEIRLLGILVCRAGFRTSRRVDAMEQGLNVALGSGAIAPGKGDRRLPPLDKPAFLDAARYVRFVGDMPLGRRTVVPPGRAMHNSRLK